MTAVANFLDEVVLTGSSADGPVQAWDVRTGMQLKAYKCVAPLPFFPPRRAADEPRRWAHGEAAPAPTVSDPTDLLLHPLHAPGRRRAAAAGCASSAKTTSVSARRDPPTHPPRRRLAERRQIPSPFTRSASSPRSVPSPTDPPVLSLPPDAVSAQVSKNALDVWGLDKESALHKFFVGEPMGVVASSPDGAFFAGGSLTGAAYVWECATGKLLRTWPAHFKAVSAMTFTPDGSMLVTGGHDTVVSAWTLATLLDPALATHPSPTPAHSWAEHSLPVTAIATGQCDGGGAGIVVSGSADRTCKIWTLGGGHLLRTISLPAAVCAVAVDACEATLYAGAADGRVFEVPLNASAAIGEAAAATATATGSMGPGRGDGRSGAAATLEGHTRAVSALACTADGERVVSASDDGTCRVWDVASRQTTHVLRHPRGLAFSALALAPRRRIVGDDGVGEKRKLAPLAPFSRFGGGGGGGGVGSGGKGSIRSWEGAPTVMRGGCASAVLRGNDEVTTFDRAGVEGSKRARGFEEVGGGGGGDDGGSTAARGEDVEELKARLAAAEAEAKAAKEETAAWKVKHGELRAFVAAELVNDAASK